MTLQEQLDAIDAQLDILIADPSKMVDYKEGDVEVKNSQKVNALLSMKKKLLATRPGTTKRIYFDFDVDEWGVERGQMER